MLKDRLDDQFQCRLNDTVFDSRYTERALFLPLGYVNTSYRQRAIAPAPQGMREFSQIVLPPLRESLHAHSVHPGCPSVLLHLGPSKLQCFKAIDFIDQTEPFTSAASNLKCNT
jgi:hypothetical protein